MKIVLTGYRGSGKSSIAHSLGQLSGWSVFDTDDLVEAQAKMSIAEIFAAEGEEGFRDRETHVVQLVSQEDSAIIATGGGAVLREVNRQILSKDSCVVWLKASVETIAQRVLEDQTTAERRPNLTSGGIKEIEEVLEIRKPIYESFCDFEIDTDGMPVEQLAKGIWSRVSESV